MPWLGTARMALALTNFYCLGMADPGFPTIADLDGLRAIYRSPSSLVKAKVKAVLDAASIAYIAASPFVLVGSRDTGGKLDVSPRGGPKGFVSVVSHNGESFLMLPDLNGNNLIDTYTNVVETGQAAMFFMVPGQGESLRVNGAAWITTDRLLLAQCTPEGFVEPKSLLVVRPDEVFMHCAKAYRRSGLWDPSTWTPDEAPDGVAILCSQGLIPVEQEAEIRAVLIAGYDVELAHDRLNP